MARDAKIIQRGMNAQDNDLALPAGTPIYSLNAEYSRGGVAERRRGFEAFWNGIPKRSIEDFQNSGKFHERFSGQHLFADTNGMLFSYDEVAAVPDWKSVPFAMSHNFRFFGDTNNPSYPNLPMMAIGRMVVRRGRTSGAASALVFNWQQSTAIATASYNNFQGTIANDPGNATVSSATQNPKLQTAFDVAPLDIINVISDDNTIRTYETGAVLAGAIGTPGSTNGTGGAARFSGASWMAGNGVSSSAALVWVADNTNQIRQVTTGGVVTTLAGSITAGDTDGVGTAARFRNISGMAYSGGFLYVAEGASAHRIRRVDVTTGSVTIYAGALTPTSGLVNGVGTAARFNTPTGIEVVGTSLFVGDSGNSRVREIVISSASVTTFAGATYSVASLGTQLVGGPKDTAILPGVVIRGRFTSSTTNGGTAGSYLSLECTAASNSTDLALLCVDTADTSNQVVHHYARCPNSLPTQTTGPNKLDTVGPNAYSFQDVRSSDVNGGCVFTTSDKPRAIDLYTRINAYESMPRLRTLGIEAPEQPNVTTVTSGTLPFAAGTAAAYRTVCGLKLPDGRVILGPPSPRVIVSNAAAWSGSITAYPSPGLPYDGMAFVQLYRTRTSVSTTDPGDQMFLANEATLSYGTGVIISDILPDDLLGAELSSNITQDGPAYSPLPPPTFCNEVAEFKNSAVLANYNERAYVRVRMLGVSGLVAGTSTITITTTGPTAVDAAITFTATAAVAENLPAKQFLLGSGGSAATNAVATAKSICNVINRNPDAFLFRAFYDESAPGEFVVYSWHPGQSDSELVPTYDATGLLTGYSPTQSQVAFATNTTVNFVVTGQVPSVRTINGVAHSEQFDPDAWPVVNQQTLAASQERIVRLLPIAETLIAVKQNSVWRYDSSYSEQIYDTSLQCEWPDSFARLNNAWIGMFTCGFARLSASSAVKIGRSIERITTPYVVSTADYAEVFSGYGTANELKNTYLCSIGAPNILNSGWRTFAYNGNVDAWSEWVIDTVPDALTLGLNGVGIPGVFRGGFVVNPGAGFGGRSQSIQRTRDYHRSSDVTRQYEYDFADAMITATGASLAGDGVTITATLTADTMPFGSASGNPYPTTLAGGWLVTGGDGYVVKSATFTGTAATFVTAQPVVNFGSPITFYLPIPFGTVYAPTFVPSNDQFCDVVCTLERLRGGSITATFFDRSDAANGNVAPYRQADGAFVGFLGPFEYGAGVSRTNVMTESETASGSPALYLYDVQRFATPAERATNQLVAVALYERKAVAPLAIKAVTVDYNNSDGGKVKR